MPSLQRPLPLLVQITIERVRLVLEPLPVLEALHDLPFGSASCLLLPLRLVGAGAGSAAAGHRRLCRLIGPAVSAQAVRLDAGVWIAGRYAATAAAAAHPNLYLVQLRAALVVADQGHGPPKKDQFEVRLWHQIVGHVCSLLDGKLKDILHVWNFT